MQSFSIGKWVFQLNALNDDEKFKFRTMVIRDGDVILQFVSENMVDLDFLLDACLLKGYLVTKR